MARVRDPAAAALQRVQVRRVRQELEVLAARDRIVTRDLHDDLIQRLYGIGLALQITRCRAASPPTITRIADHIDQLQDVIKVFRVAITTVPPGPTDTPQWRAALREMVSELTVDSARARTARLSGPLDVRRSRGPAPARRRRGRPPELTAGCAGHGRDQGRREPGDAGSLTVTTREAQLIRALVTLADTLVAGYDLAELMHDLVEVSVELLDATAAGLVLADGHGQLNVLASTSQDIEALEVLQIRTGRGPCFDCYITGEPQSIHDVSADLDRWPRFAPLALQQGFRSVHAVPMRLRDRTIGALNLFRTHPGELAEPDRHAAQALADVATIGILQVRDAEQTAEVNRKLEHALAGRVIIEQAQGILANYSGLDMNQAFTSLRDLARHHRLTLTDLARALVDRQDEPADILATLLPAPRTLSRPPPYR